MSVTPVDSPPENGPPLGDPARYVGTAVNPTTFLATDYLNHFNEAIMLLEMVGDMPECLEDLEAWAPKSYTEHFQESHFGARDLCIEAYDFVEPALRKRFETVVSALDRKVLSAIDAARSGDVTRLATDTAFLRALIDKASGMINGVDPQGADSTCPNDHIDTAAATADAIFGEMAGNAA